jgi:predicted O-methyltransferase YrrM
MYSSLEFAGKYLKYYVNAKNGKGHGIHSPFVFDFVIYVLNDQKKYECYQKIEPLRRLLLQDNTKVIVEDFGAGSAVMHAMQRKVKAIAKTSLKNEKFAKLIFRIVQYYKPETIIELGTSLGITTCYLGCANKKAQVYTFEGSNEIARIARENFEKTGLSNINLIEGNFDNTFVETLKSIGKVDLAFIDGNHRKQATLNYFSDIKNKSTTSSLLIFDDIHWSSEMREAWQEIQRDDSVTLTIDLFFIGLVFFNPDFKVKQHFSIRF